MSNLSQRLRKLEPGSHNQQYLEEVNLRLMRFAIKEKHRPHIFGIFTGDRAAESEVI
jgi:hypothetical protein